MKSVKIGNVYAGTSVLVLEERAVEDVVRARIAVDSTPRGVAVHSLGWVTALKDGESKLTPMVEPRRAHLREYIEGPVDLTEPHDVTDSMASRIAK